MYVHRARLTAGPEKHARGRSDRSRMPVTRLSPAIAYNGPMTLDNSLRASDRDREQTAERLRHAAAEGRLSSEELEERLRAAFTARTYGELAMVVRDLPGPESPTSPVRRAEPARPLRLSSARLRSVLIGLVALAALLLILLAVGVAVRRHESYVGPLPTVSSATPDSQR